MTPSTASIFVFVHIRQLKRPLLVYSSSSINWTTATSQIRFHVEKATNSARFIELLENLVDKNDSYATLLFKCSYPIE